MKNLTNPCECRNGVQNSGKNTTGTVPENATVRARCTATGHEVHINALIGIFGGLCESFAQRARSQS